MSKRILVADDEPHVLRVLAHSLEREGYEVKTVANGADAYELVVQAAPDVLITDISMPKMTGQTLCERIQEQMPDRQFLIFILTSRTEIEHREWSAALSNVKFLEKPVSTRKLLNQLEDYFDLQDASVA
ncbi:MAG: response regulator [Gammaproteobacteria bacterium]|nr:response regulator [Gammaproteobacteria bacterium]